MPGRVRQAAGLSTPSQAQTLRTHPHRAFRYYPSRKMQGTIIWSWFIICTFRIIKFATIL
jgi:hypothetical protein